MLDTTRIGKMPARVTRVSRQLISRRMTKVTTMKIKHRMNIEMLVLSPSYTTAVSELILERMSPVLVSSKNATSLCRIK
jgi:hypothetical protein